jgi:hypothetical protein
MGGTYPYWFPARNAASAFLIGYLNTQQTSSLKSYQIDWHLSLE